MAKKILYLDGTGETSGAEVSLLTLVANLNHERYEAIVALPWKGGFSDRLANRSVPVAIMEMRSLTVSDLNPLEIIQNALRTVPFILSLTRFVRENDVALIHVNSYRIGIPCSFAARLSGVPVIWHVRDIATSRASRRALSLSARLSTDRVIAISEAVAGQLTLSPSKVTTIYNGIDASFFARAGGGSQVREELGIAPTTLVVGNVGQLVPWKGQDLLVRAMAEVATVVEDVRVLLVGYDMPTIWKTSDGYRDYGQHVQTLVSDLNLKGKVTFVGFREDIASVMDALDIYVHSAVRPEPFGRVLVEAMAARKPVIAPDDGGVPEIIDHERTGLLYQPRDKQALVDAILTLARDKREREMMGRRASHAVCQRFSVEEHVRKVENLYAKLLSKR